MIFLIPHSGCTFDFWLIYYTTYLPAHSISLFNFIPTMFDKISIFFSYTFSPKHASIVVISKSSCAAFNRNNVKVWMTLFTKRKERLVCSSAYLTLVANEYRAIGLEKKHSFHIIWLFHIHLQFFRQMWKERINKTFSWKSTWKTEN